MNTLSLEASDTRSFEAAGVLSNSSLLVVVASDDPPPVPVLPETNSSSSSSSSSSSGSGSGSGAMGLPPVMSGAKRPFDALSTTGASARSVNSSSRSSGRSSGGNAGAAGGSTTAESSRQQSLQAHHQQQQQQQQQVVDLLGDSPALPTAVRKRPAFPPHSDPQQQAGAGNSRSNQTQQLQLHTPHRAGRGETAAVIDLTLS